MNVVVVRGRLARPPEVRTLGSGEQVAGYEVTVPGDGAPAESVPVVLHDPPARAVRLVPGDEVVVLGRVRRRFFRSGGATQSRTEVVAEAVVPARQASRVRGLLTDAGGRLGGA